MQITAMLKVQVTVDSVRAMRALRRAMRLVEELQADFPYREEPQQAAKALRYAIKHLTVRSVK